MQPKLVSPLSLQRAVQLTSDAAYTPPGFDSTPAPTMVVPRQVVQQGAPVGNVADFEMRELVRQPSHAKSWFPRLSFFEILIIAFGIWALVELWRRYKRKQVIEKRQRRGKRRRKTKTKNMIDIIYDYATNRREHYDDNLSYM